MSYKDVDDNDVMGNGREIPEPAAQPQRVESEPEQPDTDKGYTTQELGEARCVAFGYPPDQPTDSDLTTNTNYRGVRFPSTPAPTETLEREPIGTQKCPICGE